MKSLDEWRRVATAGMHNDTVKRILADWEHDRAALAELAAIESARPWTYIVEGDAATLPADCEFVLLACYCPRTNKRVVGRSVRVGESWGFASIERVNGFANWQPYKWRRWPEAPPMKKEINEQ